MGRSDLRGEAQFRKFCELCFFWHLFLLTDHNWSHSPDFGRPIHGPKICTPPLSYRYSESWVRLDSLGTCPEKFPGWKFSVTEQFTKKFRFSLISLSVPQKKVSGSGTHNFDATDLPNLNGYTPNISGGGPKSWPGVTGLASSTLQSQPIRKVVHDFRRFLVFFLTK